MWVRRKLALWFDTKEAVLVVAGIAYNHIILYLLLRYLFHIHFFNVC